MARRPILHAFFHSVASLGYIPFALTSAFVSSSTPFVIVPPIGIILIALVPPMTAFPLLCFSYRYLERFTSISLTVQRARAYVVLAGSGLCLLTATHLLMVHTLTNSHNSAYHHIFHSPVDLHLPSIPSTNVVPTVIFKADSGQQMTSYPGLDQTAQPIPIVISEGPKDTMEKAEAWKPSSLSSIIVDEPNLEDQQQHDLHTSLDQELKEKRDAVIPPPFKSLLSDHLRDPHKSASLVTPSEPMERDINPQKPFLATEQPASQSSNGIPIVDIPISIPITAGEDTFFPPPHVTAPPSLALPAVKPVELNSDNNHTPAEPNVQPHIPEFNPGPISLLHPPIPATAIPQSRFDEPQNDSADLDNTHGSHGKSLFQQYDAPGYNLVGLHWIIFVGTQAMLVFFLLVLFLGVLILTEYALDLEDEDIANLTYHYWARVVGVVMTTVISAVHGSLLSGYVIMDGQSDWIAKAAVGATCLYWGAMTWATNRVAGPLPY